MPTIIELRIDPELQTRLDELAEKANQGSLSPDERKEYEGYIEELDIIATRVVMIGRSISRFEARTLSGSRLPAEPPFSCSSSIRSAAWNCAKL
ncbi:MAG TPA: hypothetical protein VNH11_32795 [Pirellulales bacterium]|nr:hypothetical protein [Pirellulales bacterium]